MAFQPIVPLSGYSGWRFLQRTMPRQTEAFNESFEVKRDVDAFRERITSINSAEELVNDRQLLRVALGAFGLEDDLDNKFFIKKIIEGRSNDPEALANRLSDNRYRALNDALGLTGVGMPRAHFSFAIEEIVGRYETNQFNLAVGNTDGDMRLALNLDQGLDDVLEAATSENGHWFQMMGTPPLRTVFESAMGFPSSFAAIDIDQQLAQFKDRSSSIFGTDKLADFKDPEMKEKLIRLFMVRQQAAAFDSGISSAQTALTLVSNISYARA